MKVPLEKEPFAPVTLTFDQETQLKWLSDSIVDATLAQYDEFVTKDNRQLSKDKWKPVMSRENVTIYRRAGKGDLGAYTPKISLDNLDAKPTTEYWRMPTVLGVGTMAGALDDMLYGLLAMTKTETDVRTTYIKDQAPDSRVLATVVQPTKEDPLQALVLRWSLIYQLVHKVALRPRDLVYLESVGSRVLPSGERVGYAVMQSLDVPGCDELTDLNIVRCKFSTCYLLRDAGNGSVDLYMRSYMDPGGRVGDRVAVFASASSLIAIWRVLLCGQYKKLAWMMHRAISTRPSFAIKGAGDVFSRAKEDSGSNSCPVCEKSLSALRSHSRCDICLTKVCTRCIDKRKLTHVGLGGELNRVVTRICRTCITVASKTSARDVAISEYVSGVNWGLGLGRAHSAYGSSSSGNSLPSPTFSSLGLEKRRHTLLDPSLSISSYGSTQYEAPIDYDYDRDSYMYDERLTTPTNSREIGHSISAEEEASVDVDPQQLQLWMRINQLRVAAEETYMLTKQNANVMLEAQNSSGDSAGGSAARW